MKTRPAVLRSSASDDESSIRWRTPGAGLAPFVLGHWISHWELPAGETRSAEVLYHPCVNLITDERGCYVEGIRKARALVEVEGTGFWLGTKFVPGGFAAFTRVRVADLNDRTVPLSVVFADGKRLASELVALAEKDDEDSYFAALEGFLLATRPAAGRSYLMVREAEQQMLTAAPGTTVAEIADRIGVSMRTLQRSFDDLVGVTPKWVLKRYRMHDAAARFREGRYPNTASLAVDLGYSDQAHFIRDFKEQVGLSPLAYLEAWRAAD